MSDIAIKVEKLSKRYRIGLKEEQSDTLVGAIISLLKSPLSNFNRLRKLSNFDDNGRLDDTIWAIKDVSFEVSTGEVVGIIGRNGAGKSTLLKILSRVTEPTSGRAVVNGRVASLLEVGTGFHAELTGRENVYLNGTILGMSKREIDHKFDEIVNFAEVQKFIDTPVKRYSSGMKMRLAFAIAAHLEPEILLIDEVLAVGDAKFQNKCLGKMDEVAKAGRTVLFVSHNMAAVQKLCERGFLLDDGKLVLEGTIEDVISRYLHGSQNMIQTTSLSDRPDRHGSGEMRFTNLFLLNKACEKVSVARSGEDLTIALTYLSVRETEAHAVIRISFTNSYGQRLFLCVSSRSSNNSLQLSESGTIRCTIPMLPLLAGRYSVGLACKLDNNLADKIEDAFIIKVSDGDFFGTGRVNPHDGGDLIVKNYWEIENVHRDLLHGFVSKNALAHSE